jgi:hypothetical protein
MISVTTIRIAGIALEIVLLAILALEARKIIKDIREYNGKDRLSGE